MQGVDEPDAFQLRYAASPAASDFFLLFFFLVRLWEWGVQVGVGGVQVIVGCVLVRSSPYAFFFFFPFSWARGVRVSAGYSPVSSPPSAFFFFSFSGFLWAWGVRVSMVFSPVSSPPAPSAPIREIRI